MMKVSLLLSMAIAAPIVAQAATRVSVIELGKRGAVQRTDSRDPLTTVEGVASFWSALHSPGRRLQHAGMTVVPDIFSQASTGLVVGLKGSGVDMDTMPFVSKLLSDEGDNGVVGNLEVLGEFGDALLGKVRQVDTVAPTDFALSCKKHSEGEGLTGMMTTVQSEDSASIDSQLRDIINGLDTVASAAGKTVVLHLVVEEEAGASRRRELSRRLEGEDEEEGEGEEDNENANQNGNGNNNANQKNGYYGYGYYNSYGEWVTPYKTMFQIQYFNVVLWTAVGLTVVLFSTVYMMLYMPLMPDTLLFGESAKLTGDD
ncbi:expressed unknown protein [Seminavis robusta]|uniref:Uncharacterized protein n=1 Tax=Seminavis robusta TaxID=568900 RepID=A0A9N8ELL4_9STRA|nr:expressed unknown protein [Seminavis robusta]|eukprot:Sro1421_g271220.1 n/a (315) ;mRNA; r:17687-18800